MNNFDIKNLSWKNKPERYLVNDSKIIIETKPYTDLWSMTYFDYVKTNSPILSFKISKDFSMTLRVSYNFLENEDQCGMVVYSNDENWFKCCCMRLNENISLLSTTLTFHGYSDISSREIGSGIKYMYFRISHRNDDFIVENSFNGLRFKHMRTFHLKMRLEYFNVGFYACSPLYSSFDATFDKIKLENCLWPKYNKGEKKLWNL